MKKIKERITDYWTLRAEGFEAQRLRELESAKREIWLREIKKQPRLAAAWKPSVYPAWR